MPIVGALSCTSENGKEIMIHTGQLFESCLEKSSFLKVLNPYETELINFLEIRINANPEGTANKQEVFDFDVNETANALIPVTSPRVTNVFSSTLFAVIFVGKFAGRKEATYRTKNQGVFEVQGRLLHARDGLALWNELEDIELEALSHDAIVLLIELVKL
ncbi:MAG: hypothetical protein JWR18_2277 [Segetibacter sp.]|nr:hypothetical protein [Segetibacter sp.]